MEFILITSGQAMVEITEYEDLDEANAEADRLSQYFKGRVIVAQVLREFGS